MEINDCKYSFCKILVLEKLDIGNYCEDDCLINKHVSELIAKSGS